MELTVKDVAKMLSLPEMTIMRWIRQGKIPFQWKNGRYVFDKKQLVNWARLHNMPLREINLLKNGNEEENITLSEAIRRGGVFLGIRGETVEEVFKEAVNLLPLPSYVNRDDLLEKLIQREELCSTGIGEGIAIPHPRYPVEGLRTMVAVFFLEKEIDFKAVDGKPVFVMFFILSSSTKIHLRLLSRLSFCLKKKDFLKFLRKCNNAEELINKIQRLESSIK